MFRRTIQYSANRSFKARGHWSTMLFSSLLGVLLSFSCLSASPTSIQDDFTHYYNTDYIKGARLEPMAMFTPTMVGWKRSETCTYKTARPSHKTNPSEAGLPFSSALDCSLNCPERTTFSLPRGECSVFISLDTPAVASSCEAVNYEFAHQIYYPLGSGIMVDDGYGVARFDFQAGDSRVVYFLLSDFGDTLSQCEFVVTLNDRESPDLDCRDTLNYRVDGFQQCDTLVPASGWSPMIEDNCPEQSVFDCELIFPDGSIETYNDPESLPDVTFPLGHTSISMEYRDASGNGGLCTTEVFVRDTMVPEIAACPDDRRITTLPGSCEALIPIPLLTVLNSGCDASAVQRYRVEPPGIEGMVPGNVTLPVGSYTIFYDIEDAVGNNSNCSFEVDISDPAPPVLGECPEDRFFSASANSCQLIDTIQLPGRIDDDCLSAFSVTDSLLRPMKFDPATGELDSMILAFTKPDLNAFSTARLRIEIFGDVDDDLENFAIFNEDGTLWITSPTDDDASCSNSASISRTLSVDELSRWLDDGRLQFDLIPTVLTSGNPKPDGDPDDSNINDFCPDGSNGDGPRVLFILTYSPVSDFFYEISGATQKSLTRISRGTAVVDSFRAGVSTVELVYFDRGGNKGSCTYEVEYKDTIYPEIDCKDDYSIELFPFASDTVALNADDLLEFVGDDCGLADTLVVTDAIDCSAVGDLVKAEVFAIDHSGNTSSCEVDISIEAIDLEPSYRNSVCAGDTLFLFADPLVSDLSLNLNYEWRHPDGRLLSNALNPDIPNVEASDEGTYVFSALSSDNGCEASGEIDVEIAEVPRNLELNINLGQVCVNQTFQLSTSPWNVPNARYEWYLGTPGNSTLLTTTMEAFLDWSLPNAGMAQFYVIASNGSCSSDPSELGQIEIVETPSISLSRDSIQTCLNTELRLPGDVNAQRYEWSGPLGFTSTDQAPLVAASATQEMEGWYYFRINNNGCWSSRDSLFADIISQPSQPMLQLNSPVCEGEDLLFTTSARADSFIWVFPDNSQYATNEPTLSISSDGLSSGVVRLQVQIDGCLSELSEGKSLEINSVGELNASSNAPLCEEDTLQLTAVELPGATYSWTGPGLNSNMRSPEVPNPLPGVYILNVTAENGCTKSDSVRVSIELDPGLQGIDVNLDPQQCLTGRDSLILRPLGIPQGQSFNYVWTLPDTTIRNSRNLVFPNATRILNGTYSLVVSTASGCKSQQRSVELEFNNAPAPPQIVFTDPVCEGDQLVLTCSEVQDPTAIYVWDTPNGNLMTSAPELRVSDLSKMRDEGPYRVRVEIGNCVSAFSQVANVEVLTRPDLPPILGDSTYCEGEQLFLETTPASNFSYDWTGPSVDGDQSELIIDELDQADAGTYSLRVLDTSSNCVSELAFIQIEVDAAPQRPLLTADNPVICPGDSLQLSINLQNFDSVQWQQSPSGQLITTSSAQLRLNENEIEEGLWRARAFSGQCASSWSDFLDVRIDQEYNINIDGVTELCTGESLQLSTSISLDSATYSWIDPSGRIVGNSQRINLSNPQEGSYRLQFSSPLGCPYTDSVRLSIFESPRIDSILALGPTCVNGNQDIQLVPYVTAGDDPNLSFNWTPVNGSAGSDSIYTVSNARSNNSGDFFLQITDGNDCTTDRELINLQLNTIPPLPVVTQRDTICNGEDLLLRTQDFTGNSERYLWNTPLGQFETDEPELRLTDMSISNNGPVTVQVITPYCSSDLSLEFIPNIKDVPEAPTVTTVPSICAGDTLFLEASRVPGVPESEARYSWRGPQGFAPGVREPIIPGISENRSGYYRVRVEVNGCWSDFSDSVFVQVDSIPSAPMVIPVDDVCLDNQSGDIELAIDPQSSRPGATYQFYEAITDEPLVPFSPGLTIDLPIDTLQPGEYAVYARTLLNGCLSARSLSESFEVHQIPDTVIASLNRDSIIRCGDQPFLDAEQLPDDPNYSGLWRQVGGPNPVDINSETTSFTSINFSQLQPGAEYLFEWSIAYGSCGTYSRDTLYFFNVDADQQAVVRNSRIEICNQDFTVLEAIAPSGSVEGRWTQPTQQESLGVRIADANSATTRIDGLEIVDNQVYNFTWQLTHPICGVISSASVEVLVRKEDPCQAFAGQDQIICTEPEIELQAGSSGSCSGFWNTPGNANILSPGLPQTNVQDLEVGDNVFIWSLENLQCGLFDEDTVVITYHLAAEARDDAYDLEFADIRALDLLGNDSNTDDAVLDIIRDPQHGRLELNPDSIYYFADLEFLGQDSFSYRICDLRCLSYCDTAQVRLSIGGDLGCQIPTLITPNGDGVNDVFLIPCLASGDYPFNKVSIFNQWGDTVFEGAPYENDWRGTYKGVDLPEGTYYFVVDFGDATPVESGFVIIQR